MAAQSQKKTTMNSWLCLQTSSGNEYVLAEQLNRLGIAAYSPRYQKTVIDRYDRRHDYQMPLFRTYLFASPLYHERKSAVQLLPVRLRSRVVGDVDMEFIDYTRGRESDGFVILSRDEKKATTAREFEKGDVVMIRSGLGFGYEAIFDSYTSDEERVIILATMFNQTMRIPKLISELALAV